MKELVGFCRRLDALCGRLNEGLVVVAVVLALTIAAVSFARHPELVRAAAEAETGTILASR